MHNALFGGAGAGFSRMQVLVQGQARLQRPADATMVVVSLCIFPHFNLFLVEALICPIHS